MKDGDCSARFSLLSAEAEEVGDATELETLLDPWFPNWLSIGIEAEDCELPKGFLGRDKAPLLLGPCPSTIPCRCRAP